MSQSSLLDGIDVTKKAAQPKRSSLNAKFERNRKPIMVGLLAVMGLGSLVYGGYYAWSHRPPALPTNANEAIALVTSNKLDLLDPGRQEQYLDEAARLLRDLPDEERRKLFRDDKNREALERIREQQFDEMAKKFARGEEPDWQNMRGPGMGPGMGPGAGRPDRQPGEQPPPGAGPDGNGGPGRDGGGGGGGNGNGRGGNRGNPDSRRAMMDQRMARSLNSGNAQSVGLRGEMMKRMQQQRQSGGPQGPR